MLDIFRTLPGLVQEIDGDDALREAMVFAAWRRIAGEALAGHTAPVKLEKATLSVAVANLTWQRQLKDLCGQMLFKLNAVLGAPTVSFIELRIDEPAVRRERARTSQVDESAARSRAAEEITTELLRAAETMADEDLRRQFLAAAENCLVRRRERSESLIVNRGS